MPIRVASRLPQHRSDRSVATGDEGIQYWPGSPNVVGKTHATQRKETGPHYEGVLLYDAHTEAICRQRTKHAVIVIEGCSRNE